jgi:serine protease
MFPPRESKPACQFTLAVCLCWLIAWADLSIAEPGETGPVIQLMGESTTTHRTSPANVRRILQEPEISPAAALPNDPYAQDQWSFMPAELYAGAADIFSAQLHNASRSDVVVAIVDSGLRLDHEDYRTLPGYDFISDLSVGNDGDGRDSDPSDPGDWVDDAEVLADSSGTCVRTNSKWHGTAIAGIVGAESENQTGIAGGARQVSLLPVRVTGKCGGYVRDLLDGIRWAAGLSVGGAPANPTPARIINLSVGFPGQCTSAMQAAINDAVSAGAILVTAATNSAADLNNDPHSPASCNNVLTIGASLRSGSVAPYSALGNAVFLLGPGGNSSDGIISTDNSGERTPELGSSYGYHFGTSLAAAHVSAALATLLSIDPGLTNTQLQALLENSASPPTDAICTDGGCGNGHLNTQRAVRALLEGPTPIQDDQPATAAATPDAGGTASVSKIDICVILSALLLMSGYRRNRHVKRYQKH